jgi:hypothetical protein
LVGREAGEALDLPEGTLAAILAEVVSLDGRLDLALDRLAEALDPAGLMANDAARTRPGH